MNKLLGITAFCFTVLCYQSGLAQAPSEFDKLIQSHGINRQDLGIFIGESDSEDSMLFRLNDTKPMIPASISKLVTAAAVIESIPAGTKFKTRLFLDKPAGDAQVIKGPLYLKGGGDPGFVSENMWFLVNHFKRTGVTKIEGDIVVDDTLFDTMRFDPSRQKERVDRAYDAPTGAMSFNWNSVNVFVRPAAKIGQPAKVFIDPENEYIQLVGSVMTVGPNDKADVFVDRDEKKGFDGDVIKISGKIRIGSNEVTVFKNITKPDLWSGYNLKSFLSQRGIEVSGKVVAGSVPSSAVVVAEAESKPVEQAISDMNKFSNNYVAEMLTKQLALKSNPQGSIAGGVQIINQYLESVVGKPTSIVFENPSGLTRKNRLSAKDVWKVLIKVKEQFKHEPEFVTSLPIAGVDGTLRNRMKDSAGLRSVRAKTGYLDGVVSLAGYIGRKNGSIVPFVMIYNGSADEAKVRQLFDKIASLIVAKSEAQ